MKLTAFPTGLLSGLALFICAGLGIYLLTRGVDRPQYAFKGTTSGADLTHHGARTVEIDTTYGPLTRQTCNGACDDLSYKLLGGGDNSVSIQVRDAAGQCLSCDKGAYVTSDMAVSMHVGGVDKLTVSTRYGDDGADSSEAPAAAENLNNTRP